MNAGLEDLNLLIAPPVHHFVPGARLVKLNLSVRWPPRHRGGQLRFSVDAVLFCSAAPVNAGLEDPKLLFAPHVHDFMAGAELVRLNF